MLPIVGIQKVTTIDYPCNIAGVFFLSGCPWNCTYCYNRDIVCNKLHPVGDDVIVNFLVERKGLLDGIILSGGEPTAYRKILDLVHLVKDHGYNVGIHTNGYNHKILYKLVYSGNVDYIAMDVKAPLNKYDSITQVLHSDKNILNSIKIITESNVEHEFRTTYHPDFLSEDDMLNIMSMVSENGGINYYIQRYKNINNTSGLSENNYISPVIKELGNAVFKNFAIRG
jgi:pyruvate formate lyase activating enzyme